MRFAPILSEINPLKNMETGLKGKRVLITGGSTGIGLGIAKALGEEGVRLVVASRHPEPAGLELLRSVSPEVHAITGDVSTETGVVNMVTAAIQALGGLDLYVNNAAVAENEAVTKITAQSFFKVFNTNTAAAVFACREVARHFIRKGSGNILIVGSTSRLTPSYRDFSYRLSKTGLKVLMEHLALELAPHGIRVNLLTPGHYPTRLTSGMSPAGEEKLKQEIPLRRFGDPMQEIGASAVLLLSDQLSRYTTGSELIVDGGLSLRPINFWSDEELRDFNSPI
jgi:NAD(P)-dependent dehydrogenase (short-subunit alcohol dehydrogenase family)